MKETLEYIHDELLGCLDRALAEDGNYAYMIAGLALILRLVERLIDFEAAQAVSIPAVESTPEFQSRRPRVEVTEAMTREIVENYPAMTLDQLSIRTGLSHFIVRKVLRNAGVFLPAHPRQREAKALQDRWLRQH